MNKNKTLRFYLTEICDEFHKEKDCYYRLKFSKETVGLFNSLADVFLKIESLKTPVRLWVLRNNKFGPVISFPLTINFKSLSQSQKEEFITKLFQDSETDENFKFVAKKGIKGISVVSKEKNPLKTSKNKQKQAELTDIDNENEKSLEEILYFISKNESDEIINCSVCDKNNQEEIKSQECPCNLIELEVSDSKKQKSLSNTSSLKTKDNLEVKNLAKKNLQKTKEFIVDIPKGDLEEDDEIDENEEIRELQELFEIRRRFAEEDNEVRSPQQIIFNERLSDEYDEKLLKKARIANTILIWKSLKQEREERKKREKALKEKKKLKFDDEKYDIIEGELLDAYGLDSPSNEAYVGVNQDNDHSEFCDCPPFFSSESEKNFCPACTHNASCQWCQKYRTFLLEAKNCSTCLARFKGKNFDFETKLFELRFSNNLAQNQVKISSQICKTCTHNALCSWCQKYRAYLLEAKDCVKCKELIFAKNINLDQKIFELSHPSYPNLISNCPACTHNASCQWCQKYRTFLLEAKNCSTCLARFKGKNFDFETKLKELAVNDYQTNHFFNNQLTYNSPCLTCNHNFSCPKCLKLATFYREVKNCPACKNLLAQKNIDIDEKIYQLSYYPYFESQTLLKPAFKIEEKPSYNENCLSCSHVYFCKFCLKYRAFLLEAKNCPACGYLFAKKNLSIDYLLAIINFETHSADFVHINPLSLLTHGKIIAHNTVPEVVEIVLDYSWVKIYPYYLGIKNYPLDKFPAIIPLFQGIVYQALRDQNMAEHNTIVDYELFNTKRGYGGYNAQVSGGISIGTGNLSVDEATRVIAATTSSVDDDEEIIIVATEKSTIWGLPSYVLWFLLFAVIAVLLVVVIMFILHGAGLV
ncbi:hypothetical protein [Mesomycoplasma flocculare]|uniref:Uncharacterized protein n=1 Tax=Mesomycoplasma flocculare ATCC 27399 TaxID=743971 RepID=A0A0A8E6W3_MESFC|nr:hypothetical protein [Mesomycoplasma flocculare]AJC49743.1 hypothetical protein MYF_00985 [Mesomycoplasma flocculare ATCC 27399]ENX50737.1 hypothetical protein MFC_00856 [Mesomycoplasma flocculare ATCC 27716]